MQNQFIMVVATVKYLFVPRYKIIRSSEFSIDVDKEAEAYCALSDGQIICVKNIAFSSRNNNYVVISKEFRVKEVLYISL